MKIVLCLLVLVIIPVKVNSSETTESGSCSIDAREKDEECGDYCYQVVKPLLNYAASIRTMENQFTEMKAKIREQELIIENLNELIKSKDSQLDQLVELSSSYKTQIQIKDVLINETKVEISKLQSLIKENENTKVEDLKKSEKEQLPELQKQELIIDSLSETIKSKDIQLAKQLELISSNEKQIQEKDVIINEKEVEILKLKTPIKENDQKPANADILKESKGQQLTDSICDSNEIIHKLMITIADKEIQIMSLETNNIQMNIQMHYLQSQQREFQSNVKRLAECEDMCLTSSCVGKLTGLYKIRVPGMDPFVVLCDTKLAGPGWTVIQRRKDGSVNFKRNWAEYKAGFGDLHGEFFLGLERLYLLTNSQPHELYIYLEDFANATRFAKYSDFIIGNETESYNLKMLGNYSGNAVNDLSKHLSCKFATPDRDNEKGCAMSYESGWWFNDCFSCNLNGKYTREDVDASGNRLAWNEWHLTKTQMMIRPKV